MTKNKTMGGVAKTSVLTRSLLLLALTGTLFTLPSAALTGSQTKDEAIADQALNQKIKSRFASDELKSLLQGRQWVEITLAEAVQKGLERNISLQRSGVQNRLAALTEEETRSLFDPVFNLNAGYYYSNTYDRSFTDMKWKNATVACSGPSADPRCTNALSETPITRDYSGGFPSVINGHSVTATDPLFSVYDANSPVWYLLYDQPRAAGYYATTEKASTASATGAITSVPFGFNLNAPLPWGINLSVTERTTRKDTFFPLSSDANDPQYGSYGRPWVSSLGAAVNIPVPGGKEFGANASREVALKQAGYGREVAGELYRSSSNNTARDVEYAFWTLVSSTRVLESTMQNRKSVEALAKNTEKMFALQRVTAYAKSQVEAELAKAKGQEVVAVNAFVSASNALNQLVGFDATVVYLPTGYTKDFAQDFTITVEDALAQGRSNNPALKAQEIGVSSADLTVQQREQQTRPDVTLNGSVSSSQSNAAFGYESLAGSLAKLTTPDSLRLSAGVAYNYPWGNKGAKAALGQAQAGKELQMAAWQDAGNRIERDILNGYAGLQSARERVAITQRTVTLAEKAYDKALQGQETRRVTEYEILVKSNDLENAREGHIQAMVDVKKAEATLLAAMGALEHRYQQGANVAAAGQAVVAKAGQGVQMGKEQGQ